MIDLSSELHTYTFLSFPSTSFLAYRLFCPQMLALHTSMLTPKLHHKFYQHLPKINLHTMGVSKHEVPYVAQ